MIERKDIEPLKNEYVAVGVPNELMPDRLFFYYGTLIEITDNLVKIKLNRNAGFKLISISDIQDIHRGKPL